MECWFIESREQNKVWSVQVSFVNFRVSKRIFLPLIYIWNVDLNCLQRNRASGWRPTRNTKYSERFVCGLWNVTIVVVQLSHSTLQSVTCRGVCSDRNSCIRQSRRSSFDCPLTRHTISLGGQSIKIDMWKPCYKSMTIASLGFILSYVLYLWINEISILRLWITRFRCYQLNQSCSIKSRLIPISGNFNHPIQNYDLRY